MTQLFSEEITHDREKPQRWMLLLHGLLGQGRNWSGMARRLTERASSWGAVLADIRFHGRSLQVQGNDLAQEATLAAAARDLAGLPHWSHTEVLLGHSMGGKVALKAAASCPKLKQLWLIDISPSAEKHDTDLMGVSELIDKLAGLSKQTFSTREAFVAKLQAAGQPRGVAQWLAMNLKRVDSGWQFGLDVEAIRCFFEDHRKHDLWDALQDQARRGVECHIVAGSRSSHVDDQDRVRLVELTSECARPAQLHVVDQAGHWVHIEQPERLLELITRHVGELSPLPHGIPHD